MTSTVESRPAARSILTTCAWTTVAAIAISLGWAWGVRADAVERMASASAPNDVTVETLATLASTSLPLSRAVLLGSRDLSLESCVTPVLAGSVSDTLPADMGDYDGGPGTKLAMLLYSRRSQLSSATDDLQWHQTRLRRFLENVRRTNQAAWDSAEALRSAAEGFADRATGTGPFPTSSAALTLPEGDTWPGYCLARIDEAVRAGDIAACRRWSAEFETATFWLVDVHRWLDFLTGNFLAALDFQRLAPEAFKRLDRAGGTYEMLAAPSALPGGMLTQHGRSNFIEIERQAERLFTMPSDRTDQLRKDTSQSPECLLVPPVRRATFLAYADALSSANRRTFVAAARTPFECAFLINMLYRADSAEFVDQQCEVLRRFDRLTPHGSVEELMGVLFYRGHSFAAIEWADRFQPRLVADATVLPRENAEAFLAASRKAHALFDRDHYDVTFTLRDSLDRGVFDCVRLTDATLSLYRNSGRSGIGHVRWSAGTHGHSVAASCDADPDSPVIVADPLADHDAPHAWPEAYFTGATWPEVNRDYPKPYTSELYVRGIDQYVWAAGYVIRGENAGRYSEAVIPYLARFRAAGTRQRFTGPYPDY